MPEECASMHVVTILPPRERYAPGEAGAIALLVARLSRPQDCVYGLQPQGAVFPQGRFRKVQPKRIGLSAAHRYVRGCLSLLREESPDLIEVHNRPEIAHWLTRSMPHTPILLILHNDPCSMRQARTPAQRRRLLSVAHIVTVSEWVKARFLEGLQATGAPIALLPNCIENACLPRRVVSRSLEILFAGRVVEDKGVDAFVRACGAVLPFWPGWQARIVGGDRFGATDHRTPFLERLTGEAERHGIIMEGYKPHAAVMDMMAHAAIVIVPSRWPEPFGLTALEAMANGAAVITSPNGALPDVVGDAALLADPDAPGALEAALERLLQDASLRAELGARGRMRAALFDASDARRRLAGIRRDAVTVKSTGA